MILRIGADGASGRSHDLKAQSAVVGGGSSGAGQ